MTRRLTVICQGFLGAICLGCLDSEYCPSADRCLSLNTYFKSVVNGRPAALAVQHTDCQFPDDVDPSIGPNKEIEIGCKSSFPANVFGGINLTHLLGSGHAWKLRYGANILTASSYHVFSPRTPPYKSLLDLDKKIRSFPLPSHLRSPVRSTDTSRSWNQDPSRAMQQYCAICLRESSTPFSHELFPGSWH